ncbi:efflux RND transporter periplasmic adaptor subunit [Paracoccus sp. DMF-8]|uniref:efflux RND transporter periplasmic adaptor subunit n=1 Tax=Paracoccus sp. DMF-8 TaxID=3019445 RepID=UPI0023E77216|nr:efflux RND transporter periplasmic adaptor subunit [Paracoccus sp. DMF-8]MDF3605033.1 efflux RND transporter periplasmic adaptor subunit [Paracoccus sp. DMF-8]
MSRFRSLSTALPLVLALSALPVTTAGAQQQEMPPTPVAVVEMVPQPLPVVNELPGRVSATRTAEVRPRVGGIVLERVFEQGSLVQEGDVLYRIDPAQYAVAMASAQATLARAKANQMNARDQQARAEALRERRVTSGVDLENAVTNLAVADAEVAIAQAALDQAQLNLNYTEVTAPISGVIGRALVTEGALVSAQTDIMATVQQLDPIYADFTQSSSDVLALRRAMQAGQLVATAPGEARVRLIYDDGTLYEHPGKLLFSEATVDPLTGQVTMRGEFPNPDDDLLPGLYVRISIEQAVRNDALAVPQMAVQRDQQGNSFVYIVNAENQAERRNVKLGRTLGPRWMVMEGLDAGDKVVAEGAQKLFPGAPVAPEPWDDADAAAAALAEAAAGDQADAAADAAAVEAAGQPAEPAADPAAEPAAEQPAAEPAADAQSGGDAPAQSPTE